MNKTQRTATFLFALFFVAAISVDSCNNREIHLRKYARKVEHHLHQLEKDAESLYLTRDSVWQKGVLAAPVTDVERDQLVAYLTRLDDLPFGMYVYEKDSMVYWNNTNVLPPLFKSDQINQVKEGTLLRLKNGYYEYFSYPFSKSPFNNRTMVFLLPVKNAFRLESSYLENWFLADDYIPWQVEIFETETDFPVKNKYGKTLFYLDAAKPFKDAPQQKLLLVLLGLAFLSVCVIVNSISREIVQRFRPWLGAAFLIFCIAILRIFVFQLNLSQKFDNLEIFSKAFYTPVLNYSLGDLLLDIILLLWLMVFFHREFKVKQMVQISRTWQVLLTSLNYFSIILGILMVTSVFKSLVLDSGVTFDFDNVFLLNIYSIFAIIGVMLLLFALFLFSHRMMLTILKTGLPRKWRLVSLVSALLISLPVIYVTDLDLPFNRVVMGASIYILLFDLYIDNKKPSLVWLGTWLLYFASASAALLFKYNEDKDVITRLEYATKLAEWKDETAEKDLRNFTIALEHDSLMLDLVAKKDAKDREERILRRIDNIYSDFNYLFNLYSFDLVLEDKKNPEDTAFTPKPILKDYLKKKLAESERTSHPDIFFWSRPGKMYTYLALIYIRNPQQKGDGIFVYMEIQKRLREASMVYTELILTQYFKNLRNLAFYDYAIFKDGVEVEKSYSKPFEDALIQHKFKEGQNYLVTINNGRSELVYKPREDVTIVIGRQVRNLLKAISLFSYLFVLLAFMVFLIALLNTFTHMLPKVLQLTIWQKPSLRNKIQLAIILTIVISFMMIGWVTVIYFRNTSNDYHENRLLRKMGSVLMDAEHEIQLKMEAGEHDLDFYQLVKSVSPIHRMDINIYDLSGNLMTSTEMDIFNKGIVAPKMGALAFQTLSRMDIPEKIQTERIGKLDYKAAYVPLRFPNGQKMGYLGLPYYSKQRNLRDDVYEFMGTLLNVYVFLLLIASMIAILVANSITKPISVIGERFRRFKLGSPEPLVWNNKDELGELIEDYNRMIHQLEDYTEKLKKSEREGAWRIMAQQVAHEIKNPLTPMTLSLQFLQRTMKNDPDRAPELFEKVTKTLMEQIVNLEQIATAFSNFAKMPKPENKPMLIKDLVESVYLLFSENKGVELVMHLPPKDYEVLADKNQLMRVLNNLISNAIQAIPEDRDGKIEIDISDRDDKVIIQVSDNGCGIPPDRKEKVFAPQFTTRSSGMGLGLAMCKDIIEALGGAIYFESVIDEGTQFYVELPISRTLKD